ncbi:MAG: VWA domain-containing protein [Alphaproteobacteria bacterium]|nr:VWA domain-containing protein [Alphaproteobacteria bacterium]
MDENSLKKILSEDIAPPVDDNARKRAVNLAVAEFKASSHEKNQKKSQGNSLFARLIGKSNVYERRTQMKQRNKFLTGTALATLAAVLVVGTMVSEKTYDITKLPQGAGSKVTSGTYIEKGDAVPQRQPSSSTNNFGSIAANVSTSRSSKVAEAIVDFFSSDTDGKSDTQVSHPPGTDEAMPAYVAAVKQKNEAELERAIQNGESAIPVPMEAPTERLALSKADKRLQDKRLQEEDPLVMWRTLQEERVEGEARGNKPAEADAVAGRSAPLFNAPTSNIVIAPQPDVVPPIYQDQNRDKFEETKPNPFKTVAEEPVSTFSSDVDTASYSFVRKQLNMGRLPDRHAVRIEEMVNYFDYAYPHATDQAQPFKPTVVIMDSPWAEGKKLMQIGIKGYEISEKPRSNLVFLLDTSGSMNAPDKLPLVKSSMKMLLDSLHPDDTVAIAVYAGSAGTVLEPTKVRERSKIFNAIDNLNAGGSTAGAAGIALAYQLAEQNFDQEALNRVILATDGDFNVGMSNHEALKEYIEEKRDNGVYLSVLGFGSGNVNDQLMQALAQNGNGVAAYIDNLNEARKVLVEEATSSLFPIAKDVKFQIEFNPNTVAEYRLIGYETRALKREDFNNDKVDAGDIGAGHTVTAIYEFVPVGSEAVSIDPLRYGVKKPTAETSIPEGNTQEYAYLKMRYKLPSESKSKLITTLVKLGGGEDVYDFTNVKYEMTTAVNDLQREALFAASVAGFGQILKHDHNVGDLSMDDVIKMAQIGKGDDPFGYRSEFIQLVRLAKTFKR